MKTMIGDKKPLGEILQEAALINSGQVQVALMEQSTYYELKIGEILTLHGWIDEKTANFFADTFPQLINSPQRNKIGYYLHEAGLIDENHLKEILSEQFKTGIKFGAIAVIKGLIQQETLDFFLKHFFPEQIGKTSIRYLDKDIISQKKQTLSNGNQQSSTYRNQITYTQRNVNEKDKTTINNYEELIEEGLDDIPWVD